MTIYSEPVRKQTRLLSRCALVFAWTDRKIPKNVSDQQMILKDSIQVLQNTAKVVTTNWNGDILSALQLHYTYVQLIYSTHGSQST
jgi:hypothetical protein